MSEHEVNDPWARNPPRTTASGDNDNRNRIPPYNQHFSWGVTPPSPASLPIGSFPPPSISAPSLHQSHHEFMLSHQPPFGHPGQSMHDFRSHQMAPPTSRSFPAGMQDSSFNLSLNGLHLEDSSPWGAPNPKLIDDMNQQMASLYQRRGTVEPHSQPLASSGEALLSLLRQPPREESSSSDMDRTPEDQPPTQSPTVDPIMTESLLGLLNFNQIELERHPIQQRNSPLYDSLSFGPSLSSSHRTLESKGPRGISTAIVTPDSTKPNETIKVQISLHVNERQPGRVLLLGLFRIGQPTNDKPIFVKQVLFDNKSNQLNNQRQHWNTRITFRAPRSPGEFEFRIFEELQPASLDDSTSSLYSNTTIVRSNRLKVAMDYSHFIESLRSLSEKFRQNLSKGDTAGILSNLLAFMRLIDQIDTVFVHGQTLLEDLIAELLILVSQRSEIISTQFSPTDSIPNPMETFHGTIRNVLNTIQANPYLQDFISLESWNQLEIFQQQRYCAISGFFFLSNKDKTDYWKQEFGFSPIPLNIHEQLLTSSWIDNKLTDWLTTFSTTTLLPDSVRFQNQREGIFQLIYRHVAEALDVTSLGLSGWSSFNHSVQLDVFGSSANGFGTCASDMDLCLVFPSSVVATMTVEDKRNILLQVVSLLESRPDIFQQVDTSRLTARIPILMFTTMDPTTQEYISCDLSVENGLALRNTKLLRVYASIDPRVRMGGYLLKHFVTQRQMNCAAEGTLSTYGYLLMWIHYLQQLETPLVPVLQTLSPNTQQVCECTRITTSSTRIRLKHPCSSHCMLLERLPVGKEYRELPSILTTLSRSSTSDMESPRTIETYFYNPFESSDAKLEFLQTIAHQNTMSLGQLLIGFFYYYAREMNASQQVVSIRMGRSVSKVEKKQQYQWKLHARLSIEDPFEIHYDVAHVLKGTRDKYIRQQWMRAYHLLAHAALGKDEMDVEQVMEQVMERIDESPFLRG